MESEFWHQKWATNEIGFHLNEANPLLVKHFQSLALPINSRIFLPLCGKTLDIGWLLSQGYCVAGAELSEVAIKQLFEDLGLEPQITKLENAIHYKAGQLDIFVGDIFDLTSITIGAVDAIYDRAALVALPEDMRGLYTGHLLDITGNASQLLITFEYDQNMMNGPPFSISREEIKQHYQNAYEPVLLEEQQVAGGLKGVCEATESVWLLRK